MAHDSLHAEARRLGQEAGRAAATWAVDGNTSDGHYHRVLEMLASGDPLADQFLPAMPDLSGQHAGDPTPLSLARELTGEDDPSPSLVDSLADEWEQGVTDTFSPTCEIELRNALGLPVTATPST